MTDNNSDIDTIDDAELDRLTDPNVTATITRIDGAPLVPDADGLILGDPANSGEAIAVDEKESKKPNAIVTAEQCVRAIETGTWEHENRSTALWLNSAFPNVKGSTPEALARLLAVHGVEIVG